MLGRKSKKKPAEEQEQPSQPPSPDAALRDPLGLHHQWYLDLRMRDEIARAEITKADCSIVAWQLGVLPGEAIDEDQARRAGQIIAKALRSYDIVARTDERRFFAIIFDANFESASSVAHRVCLELQFATSQMGRWKAGVASFNRDGLNGEELIAKALSRIDKVSRSAAA
jgi:hypothetical protein